MALIKCKKCKKKISENASICPNCGYEIKKEQRKKYIEKLINKINKPIFFYILYILMGLLLGLLIAILINKIKSDNYSEEYFYESDEISYYLKLNKDNLCEYKDTLRDKLTCNYEITRINNKDVEEFKLILSLKDDDEVYTYYNCTRNSHLNNKEKGNYKSIYCENNTVEYDDKFTVYTK